jgi:hypothetical protein
MPRFAAQRSHVSCLHESELGAVQINSSAQGPNQYPATSDKGRRILSGIIQERLREFMIGIHAAGTAVSQEVPLQKRGKQVVTRTRVALISEDLSKQ